MPLEGFAVAVPSEAEQVAGVELTLAVIAPELVMETVCVPVQPLASVIVTV